MKVIAAIGAVEQTLGALLLLFALFLDILTIVRWMRHSKGLDDTPGYGCFPWPLYLAPLCCWEFSAVAELANQSCKRFAADGVPHWVSARSCLAQALEGKGAQVRITTLSHPIQQLSVLLLLLSVISWSAAVPCHAASDLNRNGDHLTSVSMIELIANPEKFDGKRVFVSGFVHFEFEGNGLYLHEEDFVDNICKNGIGLGVTQAQEKQYADRDSKYCFVIGTFHAVPPHYFSLWSGHLSDITTMGPLATSANKSGSLPNTSGFSPAQAHKAQATLYFVAIPSNTFVAIYPNTMKRDADKIAFLDAAELATFYRILSGTPEIGTPGTAAFDAADFARALNNAKKTQSFHLDHTRLRLEDGDQPPVLVDQQGVVLYGDKEYSLTPLAFVQLDHFVAGLKNSP